METDRYEDEVRPVKKNKTFEVIRVKRYLKWHITAVLDRLVILGVRTTSKRTHDSLVLRTMLNKLKKYGMDHAGSIFNADTSYDAEDNCKFVFGMDMLSNIKQRTNTRNKGERMKSRRKASELFNVSVYHYRGRIEGIFGAEETEHRRFLLQVPVEGEQGTVRGNQGHRVEH